MGTALTEADSPGHLLTRARPGPVSKARLVNWGYAGAPGRPHLLRARGSAVRLSHFDAGGAARMVDMGRKPDTERTARAQGRVVMQPATLALIRDQLAGQATSLTKGDVVGVARVAGIMAAKRTAELIPLCHPLPLTAIDVRIEPAADAPALSIEATVKTTGKTGVEMEALTAVAVAALAVYDMCKAVDRGMRIEQVRLLHKSGGASGEFLAPSESTPGAARSKERA
ncbi:MAG: cyclic pyranopterin monophosphate synthase MoaC [Actinobacteria bacterium]|nr:cyclic pyranopterin monophosphate synthase MoaC [Actinomycetota bacterium]